MVVAGHALPIHCSLTPTPQLPAFLKINPNGRIPAIVDDNAGGQRVFETASILLWIAEQYGASLFDYVARIASSWSA